MTLLMNGFVGRPTFLLFVREVSWVTASLEVEPPMSACKRASVDRTSQTSWDWEGGARAKCGQGLVAGLLRKCLDTDFELNARGKGQKGNERPGKLSNLQEETALYTFLGSQCYL